MPINHRVVASNAGVSSAVAYQPSGGPLARVPLALPTPDANPSVTHPDVIDAGPNGWKGYRYWMVMTPYPSGPRENPCILASHDGVDWIAPRANPVLPLSLAVSEGYDSWSDGEIILSPDRSQMIMFVRAIAVTPSLLEGIYRLTSTDGITWSVPVPVITTVGVLAIASPAFAYNDAGTTLYCVSVNLDAAKASKVERRTSTDNGLTWSAPSVCTIPVISGDNYAYHIDLQRAGGLWHVLVNGSVGSSGSLYYWTSTDCLTWAGDINPSVAPSGTSFDAHRDGGHYRSCFIPVPGNPLKWRLFISGIDDSNAMVTSCVWRMLSYDNFEFAKSAADEVFIPATRFMATTGTPTLGTVGSRFPVYLMDAAITEQVNTSYVLPASWRKYQIDILFANAGAGTGDIRVSIVLSTVLPSTSLALGDTGQVQKVFTCDAQNILTRANMYPSVLLSASNTAPTHLRLTRMATDATDTLTNDIGLLGVVLRKVY